MDMNWHPFQLILRCHVSYFEKKSIESRFHWTEINIFDVKGQSVKVDWHPVKSFLSFPDLLSHSLNDKDLNSSGGGPESASILTLTSPDPLDIGEAPRPWSQRGSWPWNAGPGLSQGPPLSALHPGSALRRNAESLWLSFAGWLDPTSKLVAVDHPKYGV